MITADRQLVEQVRAALAAAADPDKAAPMRAYMKSSMPFLGVQKPARVAALRPLFRSRRLPDRDCWESTIRMLWNDAAYREHRYAAIDLARHGAYRSWATDLRSLGLYDHVIVTGAWWDYVDDVAIRLVGPLRRTHPGDLDQIIRRWSRDPDRWRRRAAVICQVGAREETDLALLTACVLDNAADPDFFLRKGIGWALRDFAKTDPEWVLAFASAYQSRLSPLSLREATRNLHRL